MCRHEDLQKVLQMLVELTAEVSWIAVFFFFFFDGVLECRNEMKRKL